MSGQNNKNDFNWTSWIPIGVLFCIPGLQPIAVIWAVLKLVGVIGGRKNARQPRHPYDIQRQQAQQAQQSRQQRAQGVPPNPTVSSKAARAKSGGLIVGGGILAGIFGLGAMGAAMTFVESLIYGYFFADELMGVLVCALLTIGGLAMMAKGVGNKRQRERFVTYLAYIGANQEVGLAHMAAAFDVSVRTLCKDLRKMLSEGVLPTGYLDLAAGKLVLSEKGYQAPPPQPEPEKKEEAPAAEQPQDDNAILREIRQVNDDIPDPVMSTKIDRIEEITGKILDYQRRHPGKDSQLRSFLNYYLPTTLKILRAYAQLDAQGVAGENISAAKARIEGMMDKVVEGFENQLDKLFADSAMDITSDVAVLEQMLEKDGLSSVNQGMTLGG